MAQPTPYDRITNFQDQQATAPTDPYPSEDFDAEYNAIKITLDEILQNLSLIQRDDGAIANDSVGRDQLKDDVYIGFGAPSPWESGHDYIVADTVFQDNAFWYCEVSHTSTTFVADRNAGYWSLIADFTSAATIGARMYVGDEPPALPTQGQQWFESDTGNTFLYYDDGSSQQWIHTNGSAAGTAGDFLPLTGGTMTGSLTLDVPSGGANEGMIAKNTSYVLNVDRFGNPLVAVNADSTVNALVACVNNDAAANTPIFPSAVTGSAVIQNNGNTGFGGYFECHQYGTGPGCGVEIDSFNYSGAPSVVLPPNRTLGAGAALLPVGLTLVAGDANHLSGATCFDGSIGMHIPKQTGAAIKWAAAGIYVDPGAVGQYGVFVDADNSNGPTVAAGRFDIKGAATDVGIYVGVHGGLLGTPIKVNNGGTDRFVVNSVGDITEAGGAWMAYTPTVGALSGTLGTHSASGRWKAIGKTVFVSIFIGITTNGSALSGLTVTLPRASQSFALLPARRITVDGHMCTATLNPSSTSCNVQKFDNSYPGGDGINLVISGSYEST